MGEAVRTKFNEHVEKILDRVSNLMDTDLMEPILSKFTTAVKGKVNIWKDRRVIKQGKGNPLNEAQINYLLSLLNEGFLRGDKKMKHFKDTGTTEVVNYD